MLHAEGLDVRQTLKFAVRAELHKKQSPKPLEILMKRGHDIPVDAHQQIGKLHAAPLDKILALRELKNAVRTPLHKCGLQNHWKTQ